MNAQLLIEVSALAASFLFIYGLKRMSSPVTARSGIVVAGYGMLVAVLASFLYTFGVAEAAKPHLTTNAIVAITALLIGVGWAWWSGKKVEMTAMPQMVALYNGMGGGSAAAIAAMVLLATPTEGASHGSLHYLVTVFGGLIGAVSLSGSLIAWAKLDGRINKTLRMTGIQAINGTIMLATLGIGLYIVFGAGGHAPAGVTVAFFALALIFGVMMTMPIGGADMPVVISLYNAFTGLAVGLEGYVLNNPALMIAGMVVGSAGTLLTLLMAKAMNRSVSNVIFSNFGAAGDEQQGEIKGSMKPVDAGDAGIQMRYASKVIIAPGYGLAVAQAQHKLFEFVKLLQAAGVEVKFAIHPVAGRMPGHMNVLLAEAGVPYDIIYDMEDINGEFKEAD
ncbi:MAG TPA: NAD(P)(+) transhydrogenase (Re/Si-specific) subunit beta, partial [Fontimonas sp.]